MNYRKFLSTIDIIFLTIIIFLVSFIWSRYFYRDIAPSLIVAMFVTVLAVFILVITKIRRENKSSQLQIKQKNNQKIDSYFLFASDREVSEFVEKHLERAKYKEYDILYNFSSEKIDTESIISSLKNDSFSKKVLLLCVGWTPEAQNFVDSIENYDIKLAKVSDVFQEVGMENFPDNKFVFNQKRKFRWREFLSVVFNRKNSKGYLFSALILAFASFIVPYNFYYLFFASSMCLLSLLCIVLQKKLAV